MGKEAVKVQDGPSKIWNPTFVSVFIAGCLMQMVVQMMSTIIPKYVNSMGAPATLVGFVASAFTITALIFKIVSAPIIDAYDKKKILTVTLLIVTAAVAGYAVAGSVTTVIVARLLQGVGQAFTVTCALTIATNALPPDKLGVGLGIYSTSDAICRAFAPALTLAISDRFSYTAVFLVAAGIMVVATISAASIRLKLPGTGHFRVSLSSVVAAEALIPALLMLLLHCAYYSLSSFLVIYAETRGVSGIGYYFTIYALTMLVFRPLLGRLSDKFGGVRVMIPAFLCYALSFVIISVSASLPMFYLAAFISAIGYGASHPVVQALSMKSVPKEKRGAASCTNYIGQDLGNLAGGLTAGWLVQWFHYNYAAMWRMQLLPIGLCILLVVVFRRRIAAIEATAK